jgi:polyisoprenyl-phosphate glycosyltransferase
MVQKMERTFDSNAALSVVVPCYNEEEVLPMLYERISAAARDWPVNYEVILVDDGSKDSTWELMCALQAKDPRWRCVRLARNFGHQLALWTGLQHADGDVIAILDADLQDPPEILSQFIEKWREGYDVIYAVRRKRKENIFKRLAYFSFYRIFRALCEVPVPLDSGDFCVLDRRVLDAMLQVKETEPFIRGLRAWVGFRQTGIEYERSGRAAGDAKYTFRKLVKLAASGLLGFSTAPLRISLYLGLGASGLALLGVLYALFQIVFSRFVHAWLLPLPDQSVNILLSLFLGGAQLLCIGLMGEYLGRVYANTKGRPQSVVAETTGFQKMSVLGRTQPNEQRAAVAG